MTGRTARRYARAMPEPADPTRARYVKSYAVRRAFRDAIQQPPDVAGKGFGSPEFRKAMQDMMAAFEADVTEALIPFIDQTFRTIPDRDHRAMAGLSMGGMQTYHITLNHLDLFSHIGGFSGAAGPFITGRDVDFKNDYHGVLADPAAFAKRVHVLWLGVGTAEPEGMRAGIRKLHASLTEPAFDHPAEWVVVIAASRSEDLAWLTLVSYGLSPREEEVVKLVVGGLATKQISDRLFITEHTVQRHLSNIFEKVGVRSRRALIKELFFDQMLPGM